MKMWIWQINESVSLLLPVTCGLLLWQHWMHCVIPQWYWRLRCFNMLQWTGSTNQSTSQSNPSGSHQTQSQTPWCHAIDLAGCPGPRASLGFAFATSVYVRGWCHCQNALVIHWCFWIFWPTCPPPPFLAGKSEPIWVCCWRWWSLHLWNAADDAALLDAWAQWAMWPNIRWNLKWLWLIHSPLKPEWQWHLNQWSKCALLGFPTDGDWGQAESTDWTKWLRCWKTDSDPDC